MTEVVMRYREIQVPWLYKRQNSQLHFQDQNLQPYKIHFWEVWHSEPLYTATITAQPDSTEAAALKKPYCQAMCKS